MLLQISISTKFTEDDNTELPEVNLERSFNLFLSFMNWGDAAEILLFNLHLHWSHDKVQESI